MHYSSCGGLHLMHEVDEDCSAERRARPAAPQVVAPLLLLTAFRHGMHPALELLASNRVDIGTAHLWFILTVALGRAAATTPLRALPWSLL